MTILEDIPHQLKSIVISKHNIQTLVMMRTARSLHEDQVRKIHALLLQGKHFASPFVINVVKGDGILKNELIDGNNRSEAINRIIKEDENFKIRVDCIIYENLAPEQKANVFDNFNLGIKVNARDMLVVHQDDLPAVRDILNEYPVPVVTGRKALNPSEPYVFLSALVHAHLNVVHRNSVGGGSQGGWKAAKEMDRRDYYLMRQFGEDFARFSTDAFHEGVMSVFAFRIMYRTWYINCIDMPFTANPRPLFVERAWNVMHMSDVLEAFRKVRRAGGRYEESIGAERYFVDMMNSKHDEKVRCPADFYGRAAGVTGEGAGA